MKHKTNNEYSFFIKFCGVDFYCSVKDINVTIQHNSIVNEKMYEVVRKYIENEGFIIELDQRRGILDKFKS